MTRITHVTPPHALGLTFGCLLAGLASVLAPSTGGAQASSTRQAAPTARSTPAPRRVRQFAEMTAADVARLDGAHTVILLPGGVLEEHGPYLPVNADGYRNDRLANELAASIVAARPGGTAVVLPFVPLGAGAFNVAAGRPVFAGSATVRAATLRAVFMDLADALGGRVSAPSSSCMGMATPITTGRWTSLATTSTTRTAAR